MYYLLYDDGLKDELKLNVIPSLLTCEIFKTKKIVSLAIKKSQTVLELIKNALSIDWTLTESYMLSLINLGRICRRRDCVITNHKFVDQ